MLIIPVEGCAALVTPTPIPLPTNTPFALTRVAPTTYAAAHRGQRTSRDRRCDQLGSVNSEMVELRNVGNVVNLQGWTLSSESGEIFIFPEFRLQNGQRVRLYTRQGNRHPRRALLVARTRSGRKAIPSPYRLRRTGADGLPRGRNDDPLFQEATLSPGGWKRIRPAAGRMQ